MNWFDDFFFSLGGSVIVERASIFFLSVSSIFNYRYGKLFYPHFSTGAFMFGRGSLSEICLIQLWMTIETFSLSGQIIIFISISMKGWGGKWFMNQNWRRISYEYWADCWRICGEIKVIHQCWMDMRELYNKCTVHIVWGGQHTHIWPEDKAATFDAYIISIQFYDFVVVVVDVVGVESGTFCASERKFGRVS